MERLNDYNNFLIIQKNKTINDNRASVLCDKCNNEMIYEDTCQVLLSDPPKKTVYCLKCGHRGYKIL